MKLGIDFWSLHSQGWRVLEQIEYAHRIGIDVVHSELYFFESLDDGYLRQVRSRATELSLELETGMGSICPTSTSFPYLGWPGTAVEHLSRALHAAHEVGSRSLRCFLGSGRDRSTQTPIEAHIGATVETCRAVRSLALDLGVKIAVETHGDLSGMELKALIEAAGPEYVGACLDIGNPVGMAESPFVTLDYLAPYVVQSHIRDSALWEHPRGAAMQSVAVGEGTIGIDQWAKSFQERCPGSAFTLETFTGSPPSVLNYLEAEFWHLYPNRAAAEFAEFLKLVRQGRPYLGAMLTVGPGEIPSEYRMALVVQERLDVERSIAYCRDVLKLGERTVR